MEDIDVIFAVLAVAEHLRDGGYADEAGALKLELGELLIRAALHKDAHPGPIALGKLMAAFVDREQGTKQGTAGKDRKGKRRSG